MTRGVRSAIAGSFFSMPGYGLPGYQENIGPAIVIQIHHAGAPADVSGFDSEPCAQRGYFKVARSIVDVEFVCVFGEVRFEEIEIAIEIEIADSHAHPCLHLAILGKGDAAFERIVMEGAVVAIVEEEAGSGIAGNEDIGPAIVYRDRLRWRS